MPEPAVSPLLAARAGNGARIATARPADPVFVAWRRWNTDLVLTGAAPASSDEPTADGRAYAVEGAAQKYCRPFVRVAWRTGWLEGPEVRFEQRDDGMHLTVAFEEDPAQRAAGAAPFDVRITSVRLVYGPDPADVLAFTDVTQEPGAKDAAGPAFRVEADTLVPGDERRARIVAAMQRGAPRWVVTLEFQWVKLTPAPARPPAGPAAGAAPGGLRVAARVPWAAADRVAVRPAAVPAPRPAMIRAILATPVAPPPPTREVRTLTIERRLNAEYPDSPENRPIFAAVTGDYTQAGWRSSAHGWYQPTPIQDTVYCLPDAYRLQVDPVTGRPSIQAVLLRKQEGAEPADDLDPTLYRTRLTLRARPDFDVNRLASLRALIRAESSNQVRYADLVLGGYGAARFLPDDSLAGLGELFAGSTAAGREALDPAQGFAVTYEGNAEFADLIFQRLRGEGIGGVVELDLTEPGGRTRKHQVPVTLTLRQPAPLALPLELAAEEAALPDETGLLPQQFRVRNPTPVPVRIAGLQAHAVQRSPITGRALEWCPARPEQVAFPLALAPGDARVLRLRLDPPADGTGPAQAVYNSWDLALADARPETSEQLMLDQLFDAATGGVRGWKVEVECPAFAFFDRLTPEDRARMEDVIALEVEVRRAGTDAVEEVKLTRDKPRDRVLLSRTVADFVSDRATGRSKLQYRRRVLRIVRAEAWSDWTDESGTSLTVFPF
jgi:hypothetical protein